jgi:hypothetical protein
MKMPKARNVTILVHVDPKDLEHDLATAALLDMLRYAGLIQRPNILKFPEYFTYQVSQRDDYMNQIDRWASFGMHADVVTIEV